MAIGNIQAGQSKILTGSAIVKSSDGAIIGVLINSGTNVAFKVWNNTTGSGTALVETTVAVTPTQPIYIPLPVAFDSNGCFFTVAGTTPVITVFYL